MSVQFDPSMYLAILPEIGLIVLAAITLVLDLVWQDRRCRYLGWITAGGLAVIAGLAVAFARPGPEPLLIFGGMLRLDDTGFVFRLIFLFGATITALFAVDNEGLCNKGEFFTLLLVSTLGMSLMASSADLIMLFLAIETTSIPLYVLAGFIIRDQNSVEAGIKYLLFGAMTSAISLYGFSLLYGFSGTTQIYAMGEVFAAGQISPVLIGMSILLVVVGFAFKVSAVPFHFWAPDVYQGAPTVVTGMMSSVGKTAAFGALISFFSIFALNNIPMVVAMVAILTMLYGNVVALVQTNIKRLLAYSSIAHAGYIMVGFLSINSASIRAVMFYLVSYILMQSGAFIIISMVEEKTGDNTSKNTLESYKGLGKTNPMLSLLMTIFLFSLAGIPPFAGFWGKYYIFLSAIQVNYLWVAIVGILLSLVGVYYYIKVILYMWFYEPVSETTTAYRSDFSYTAAIISVIGLFAFGIYPDLILRYLRSII